MKNKSNLRNYKVGLLVLVCIFLIYYGLNFLKGLNVFSSETVYYTQFADVEGLQKSAPINIKGYKVGQIMDIRYEPLGAQPFTVTISIASNTKLPANAKIECYEDGLLGGKALRVVFDERDLTLNDNFKDGDTIPAFVSQGLMGMITNDLAGTIKSVAAQADTLIRSLREITESAELKKTLISLEKTSAHLSTSSAKLDKMMSGDIPAILGNVQNITADFQTLSANLKQIDFKSTLDSVNFTVSSLNAFTRNLNNPNGSLGLLMNDKQLYINLKDASQSANNLLIDLKDNPKRYVHFSIFGSKK